MPFTFSHPAAVLPLTYLPKSWTSMTGLVIGSLAPDFEYFLRMRVYSSYSHTWTGMFWFDLPLTIILAFAFHIIVRNSFINNLPVFLTRRFLVFTGFDWSRHFKENFLVVIVSILFGVTTHILWDNFTHEHGHFVQKYDSMQKNLTIAGNSIAVYKLLQHASTIIGGIIIIYALFQLPPDTNYQRKNSIFRYWFLVSMIILITIGIRLSTGLDYRQFGDVIVTMIAGGLIGLLLTPKLIAKKLL